MLRRTPGFLEHVALLEQHHELVEEATDLFGVGAVDGDLVAPHVHDRAGVGGLDEAEQLVALAEQADHQVIAGNVDLDLRVGHGPPIVGPGAADPCPDSAVARVAPASGG